MAGDSWACGEYVFASHVIQNSHDIHGGIQDFLKQSGIDTLCFGYPGLGSLSAFDFVNNFIEFNQQSITIDRLIFFQSDWIRDIRSYRWLNEQHLDIWKKGYLATKDWYVSSLYYKLSNLYKNFGVPTVLIGGLADTIWIDKFEEEYPGVTIGCQSMINLLVNGDPKVVTPTQSVFRFGQNTSLFLTQDQFTFFIENIKKNSDNHNIEFLLEDMEKAEKRNTVLLSHSNIFPDKMHPDRHGHKKLFDLLVSNNFL